MFYTREIQMKTENVTYKWSNWNKAVKLLINKKLSERTEVKYNEK